MSSDSESIIIGHHEEFAFTDSEEEKKKDVNLCTFCPLIFFQ